MIQRIRSREAWLAAALFLMVMGVATVVWKNLRARGFGRPFRVLKLTPVPASDGPARTGLAGAPDPALLASVRELAQQVRSIPRTPAAVPVRRIDGPAFMASAEQAGPLSTQQRARLGDTLRLAATMQRTIDATPSLDARAELQQRLDDQVRTRLRLLLPPGAQALVSQLDESAGPVAFQFGE